MFYSESLLSKTGPLARIWLSANIERKVSKTQVLQSNIESSVNAIVDQGTAPMALRLSGHLLLGVVRIYSRKARYLLDDCNEALLKIKMAFRPGNVDLPVDLAMPAAGTLTLADKISDPLMPEFDPSLLEFPERSTSLASKKDDPLVWNSQVISEPSIELGRNAPARDQRADFDEDDMNIDLGLDLGQDDGPSIEFGRNAFPPLDMDDDLMGSNLISKDVNADVANRTRSNSDVPSLIEDREEPLPDEADLILDGGDDFALPLDNDPAPAAISTIPRLERDSQSPLSSLPSDDLQERDLTHVHIEDEEPSVHQAVHKAKRRKVLPSDSVTMLTSDIIKKQQADRSAILKPTQFLPRDRMLLNLMSLQKRGGFVSSIIGDGPIKGLAPELRGVLSIEVVRKSSQLKRKRDEDASQADVGAEDEAEQSRVQLEIPEDDTRIAAADDDDSVGGDFAAADEGLPELPGDDGHDQVQDDPILPGEEDLDDLDASRDRFDETTAPLLHPMEQGAISQGTKHAVHLLRDQFGASVDGTPSSQKKANILFQELLPERSTSKADATKMFFETLVLATKDAIKVEQGDKQVGSNIRIRAKRGLWGAWAEREAGGEIAGQGQESAPETATAIAHELNHSLSSLRLANAYDLSSRIFLLKFQKPDRRESLVIDSGFRCHLTNFTRTTASGPSAFVTRLRKYLKSRRLTSVSQVGTDRILELQFSDGQYRLFLEFYAGGNIILTDRDLSILALLRLVPEGPEQEQLRLGLKYCLENKQNFHGIPPLTKERIQQGLEAAAQKPSLNSVASTKKSKKTAEASVRKALANTFHEFPPVLIEHALNAAHVVIADSIDGTLSDRSQVTSLLDALNGAKGVRDNVTTEDNCKGYIIAKSRLSPPVAAEKQDIGLPQQSAKQHLVYEDFQPFAPQQFKNDPTFALLEFDNFNKTVDEFFSSVESQKLESRITERENHAKKKLENAKQDHEKRLDGLQQVQELNVRKAQAIESNLDRVQEAIMAVNSLIAQGIEWPQIAQMIEMEQRRHNPVAEMIRLPLKLYENTITLLVAEANYDDEADFEGDLTDSEVPEGEEDGNEQNRQSADKRLAVDVDLALSPWSNARQYYDQKRTAAEKKMRTLQASAKALKSTEAKIKADLKKGLKQEKDLMRPQRKAFWFEKFFYFISSEGYLVLGGKDGQQNEILYSRFLKKGDLYIHADLPGASIMVVKNKPGRSGDPIPPSTLSQAGSQAVCTSSAWDSKAVMAAWWVSASQVSKLATNGDYLPQGIFNVEGGKNFLPPAQLLLGFGIMFKVSEESKAKHQKHRLVEDQTIQSRDSNQDEVSQDKSINVEENAENDQIDLTEEAKITEEQRVKSEEALVHEELNVSESSDSESEPEDMPANPLQLGTNEPNRSLESTQFETGNAVDDDHKIDMNGTAMAPSEDDNLSTGPVSSEADEADEGKLDQKSDQADKIDDHDTSTASVSIQTPAPVVPSTLGSKNKQVRGKQGKRNKLKSKYADQDEEDRALAMRLLGSAAAQEKAKEDATTKLKREEELAAAKVRRRKQHELAAEKGRRAEEQRRKDFEKATGAEGNQGGAIDDDIEQQQEEDLECFIGTPLPGDEILDILVVCGPWDAIGRKCKWRVKLQPGAVKKGKAVKEILGSWNATLMEREKKAARKQPRKNPSSTNPESEDRAEDSAAATSETTSTLPAVIIDEQENLSEEEQMMRREAELIRGIRDVEVVGVVPVAKMRTVIGASGGGGGGGESKGKGHHSGTPGKGKRGGKGSKKQR